LDDYKRAFTPNTAMTQFFNAADAGEIGREDWVDVAHQHNVPCHLDAAADMPPIENLWKYTGMGFDLVSFSGGKGIRGPQNAGLLLGKKRLTDLAQANNNPLDGSVGRGMKVAKEQLVGMVAAIDWLLDQTDDGLDTEYRRRCEAIIGIVKDVPTLRANIVVPAIANHVPHLVLTYDPATLGITPREAQQRLLTGTPVIELNPHTGSKRASQGMPAATPNALVLTAWMLQPGDELIVGHQIRQVLLKPESVGHLPPGGIPSARAGRAGNAEAGGN
jgi:seryl-tRNA(Sec) selenium transferase